MLNIAMLAFVITQGKNCQLILTDILKNIFKPLSTTLLISPMSALCLFL